MKFGRFFQSVVRPQYSADGAFTSATFYIKVIHPHVDFGYCHDKTL